MRLIPQQNFTSTNTTLNTEAQNTLPPLRSLKTFLHKEFQFTGLASKGVSTLITLQNSTNKFIDQIVGAVPDFQARLAAFAALGVEVAITELDVRSVRRSFILVLALTVRFRLTLPATTASLAQQKTDYQNIIGDCKAVSACVGVTIWDYTDKVGSCHFY